MDLPLLFGLLSLISRIYLRNYLAFLKGEESLLKLAHPTVIIQSLLEIPFFLIEFTEGVAPLQHEIKCF